MKLESNAKLLFIFKQLIELGHNFSLQLDADGGQKHFIVG